MSIKRLAIYIANPLVVLVFCLLTYVPHMSAEASGSPVYVPSSNEVTAYARVIQLQYGQNKNLMLATFEHWYTDGSNVPLLIRQSADNGKTWSKLSSAYDPNGNDAMYQPALFEFPVAIGGYPAGTLLLVANSIENGFEEHFMTWRSTNQGQSWTYVNTFQTGYSGGSPSTGIWEPFLYLDAAGQLVCVFSDERQAPTHSQLIGEVISTDGGATWSNETPVVVGTSSTDRPGMPTVARMGSSGSYILAVEYCNGQTCQVHTKTSADGSTWAGGIGTPVATSDSNERSPDGSPYIAWSSSGGVNGTLYLSSAMVCFAQGGIEQPCPGISANIAPEDQQAIFVNSNLGSGSWSWMGAPYYPFGATGTSTHYSPALLVSGDGTTISQMCTTGVNSSGGDQVTNGYENAAVLPYSDPFSQQGTDAGWVDYNGTWSVSGGAYSDSNASGSSDKALAGSTGWTDYVLSGDVMITSSSTNAQAGFLVRASNPSAAGFDGVNGYYIGVTSNVLFIGRENGSWTGLGSASLAETLPENTWYHISVTVQGSNITVTGQPAAGGPTTTIPTVTDSSFLSGAVGVRDLATTASWKAITVTPLQ